jgi:uncharacterized protein YcbK (DUF882 family)
MGDLSPHFSTSEMQCKCGCGKCLLDPALIPALEALHALGPEAIFVDDGYRCEAHNAAVGGVPHSEHPKGEAADVRIGSLSLQEQYDRAKQVPAFANGGIGVYSENFLHVDVRAGKARWARKNGVYIGLGALVTP